MDYLDLGKERRHNITLFTGYILVAVAIVIATLVLVYQAYGFGLGKDGTVIQNGLIFFSSQPNPADIIVNNKPESLQTNTRLILPDGRYQVKLQREGYYDWQRTIDLPGGSVQHFDYPFLFPKTFTNTKLQTFTTAPAFSTQSPDKRWLLIQTGSAANFSLYDLKNPEKAPLTANLPADLLTKATNESWQLVEWASDNKHVLLEHLHDGKNEFVLVDRAEPAKSVNLNRQLALNPASMTLNDKKFDRYFIHDPTTELLQAVTLDAPAPIRVLDKVLSYKTYSDDVILYVTSRDADAGKVSVKLRIGDRSLQVRQLSAGTNYMVDLAKYDDSLYVAAGAAADNKVYIYKDVDDQLAKQPVTVPTQVLYVEQVNHVSFSASAQFVMAENGNRFGVYDIENKIGYNYSTKAPLDAPQTHASWMDGNRLHYVSAGKLKVFDYDNLNIRDLPAASPNHLPAFAPDYENVYLIAPSANAGQLDLMQAALLAPADR